MSMPLLARPHPPSHLLFYCHTLRRRATTFSTYTELTNVVVPEDVDHCCHHTQSSSDQELDDSLKDVFVQHAVIAINQRACELCDGCSINHPSQKQHMLGCLASSYDKVDAYLQYVLDSALSRLFARWSTSTWRNEMRQTVLTEFDRASASPRVAPYYYALSPVLNMNYSLGD